ncbi:septal ring lytic transglycosylase RlpA family protein [Pseudomonadota bacterium]
MINKVTYIIIILMAIPSCGGEVGYNHTTRNLHYRYQKVSNSSQIHYNFRQDMVKYKLNNRPTRGRRSSWQSYIGLDHEDSDYSGGNYSLYKKPKNYTGYYKIGKPYEVLGQKYCPMEDKRYKETGVASWYGEKFYGKKTANGEIYNMHDLTAAHRTLPLPSIVRVTNLNNGKSIKVRVNDRGPFAKDRIIDVSKETAQKLGFIGYGTAKVKVEYLHDDTEKMLYNFGLK